MGFRQAGAGGQCNGHAAEQRIPVPPAAQPLGRDRRHRLQPGRPGLDAGEEQVLATLLDQTAIAIDRARLSKESLDQAAKLEGERFRSSLLSSISHDLKTPLATITGAVSSLRQLGDKMTPASRDDLLASIEEESDRLSRFVANLLDMTRIEAGTVDPQARLG